VLSGFTRRGVKRHSGCLSQQLQNSMRITHCIIGLAALAFSVSPVCAQTAQVSQAARQLASSNNDFACDLYAQLKETEGNLFFSPFSVSSALAMTYAGAKGETAEQMRKALRFSGEQADTHAGFAALRRHFDEVQRGGSVQLNIANSLWPQKNAEAPLLKDFLALVKQNYGVEITPVDFVRAEPKARARINQWVAEKTQDKITVIIGSPLDSLTRLVLVNAVYFKGTWESVFEPELTKEEPFHIWDRKDIKVPLMRQKNWYRYGEQSGAQLIEFPYVDGKISMFVILLLAFWLSTRVLR